MKKIIMLLPLLLVSGCDLFRPPLTRQELLTIYRDKCLEYGFEWGTPEFAKCVQDQEYKEEKLSLERRKARALEDQTFLERQRAGNLKPQGYPKF
ncbi:hypothetical protein Bealeia1_01722 [Candidatus Bealeia paramacronuclearis]|uniref:Lipoprotein n=1 Tax=Candidatus Bealeia paramacronuclearis TaxID=1921001 RepID=A0ABZ2C524_9PROT|nr:hypothetical protein [Candidatus Bealeia paramacronuclearis]